MESPSVNRQIRLRRRPRGRICDGDFELVSEPIPRLRPGQALIRNLVLSVEAASRIWVGHKRAFMPPVAIGDVMRGIGIGAVVDSRRADLQAGDTVVGFLGWQQYCVADASSLEAPLTVLPRPLPAPPSAFLGVMGHIGISAYLGIDYLDPSPGQTLIVSAAGGGVGSLAGQLAKMRGAWVVGIAGGQDKCRYVMQELGFDACVDRNDPDWAALLDAATPNGIDLVFENVGGLIMDHILMRLTVGARVFLCGMAAHYNDDGAAAGPSALVNIDQLHMQRASLRGFVVTDHLDRWPEAIDYLAQHWARGELVYCETKRYGLDQAVPALCDLMAGTTRGKVVIELAAPQMTQSD